MRLIDGKGRFNLKPGEIVEFKSVPADLTPLIEKEILISVRPDSDKSEKGGVEVKPKSKEQKAKAGEKPADLSSQTPVTQKKQVVEKESKSAEVKVSPKSGTDKK